MENKKQALKQLHEIIIQLLLENEESDFVPDLAVVHSEDFKFEVKYTSKFERKLKLIKNDD